MAVNEPLSLLEPVDLPLRDDDLFYVVQSGVTSTSTASRQITFLDFVGEISTSVTGIEVQVNGVPISDQSLLNLTNTASVTWSNPSGGEVRATATGGGGGGGLTLIEHHLFTSDGQSHTFSGLDGNTDGVYKLIMMAKNGGTGTSLYTIQPNAATTNQTESRFNTDGSVMGNTTNTNLQIGFNAANNFCLAELTMYARCNPNSVAFPRMFISRYVSGPTSVNNTGGYGGTWNETAANITSLVVTGDQADSFKAGSELWLYKFEQ